VLKGAPPVDQEGQDMQVFFLSLKYHNADLSIINTIELFNAIAQPFLNGLEAYTGLKFTLVNDWPPRKDSTKFQVLA